MLLSRQALPGPGPESWGLPLTIAAVAAVKPAPPPGAGGSEITPLNWIATGPGPVSVVDGASRATMAVITLQDESGDSGEDAGGVVWGDPTDPAGEASAADVPDPTSSPADPDSAEELIYEGLDGLDPVPWQANCTVEGSLNASRPWIAYRIPVGPGTNSLRLTLRPGLAEFGTPPLIEKLYLVDSGGGVLARVASATMDGGGGPLLLVTIQGAPVGAQLVVRLTMEDARLPAAPGGAAEESVADFVFSVQRSDPAPSSSTSEDGVPGSIATLPAPSPLPKPSAGVGYGPIGWTAQQPGRLALDGRGASDGGLPSTGAASWTETGRLAGGRAPSVNLGPLVSRGAAPLGPALATSTDEPTGLIDRDATTVDEAIARLGAELDSGLIAGLRRRGAAAVGDAESPTAATRVVPGAGGLPVLVAATTRTREDSEADALAANLQSRSVEEALNAEAPEAALAADGGVDDAPRLAKAGVVTRAAGLIIGLGLATGPLYPDLVALARRKLGRGKRPFLRSRWFNRGRPPRPIF